MLLKRLEQELQSNKKQLATDTKALKEKQSSNIREAQKTGIVSDEKLSVDFENRKSECDTLEKDIDALKRKHERLTMEIEQARLIRQRT